MLPSQRDSVNRLSKLQREFLIDHVDGLRPFADQPVENATRAALLWRKLIRYEPPRTNRLGRPNGTVLTDDGREALGFILGCYADSLTRAIKAHQLGEQREALLLRALHESAHHSRINEAQQDALFMTGGEVDAKH